MFHQLLSNNVLDEEDYKCHSGFYCYHGKSDSLQPRFANGWFIGHSWLLNLFSLGGTHFFPSQFDCLYMGTYSLSYSCYLTADPTSFL